MKRISLKTIIFSVILVTTLLIITGLGIFLNRVVSPGFNIQETTYIYITEEKNYDKLINDLQDSTQIKSISTFKRVSSLLNYPTQMKTGRYAVTPSTTVKGLVEALRSGQQVPVNFKFNNIRIKKDLATRISNQLMLTEEQLVEALNDSVVCDELGFQLETIPAMFIPNTYQVYWDVSLSAFLKRMKAEYNKFWNEDRLFKAKSLNLTPIQVSTLASIVEEECFFQDEYSTVAGLYLNRLNRGQKLQADPTVKFAVGDFELRRILFKHLSTDSPYNTYKHQGLPPGPIRIPSIKGIDAVLNPAKHDYLFMCAKEDLSGRHSFTRSGIEHERNAARYRKALNQRGIYK